MSYEVRDTSRVAWPIEHSEVVKAANLILARIDRDVGSWRLYRGDCEREGIITGEATPVLSGYSTYSEFGRRWLNPDAADIERAVALVRARETTEKPSPAARR
ncbi:MAG TPA: hypothetical protein VFW04_02570 [Gemmatimonadaceae bacterium]|nr:hypothetical protein [Gemmatimonadaceae bacterium]